MCRFAQILLKTCVIDLPSSATSFFALDCLPEQSVTVTAAREVGMTVKQKPDISELLVDLPRANSKRLRELWLEHIGRPASLRLRPSIMRPVLAYKIQEHAYGGLRPDIEKQLKSLLKRLTPGSRQAEEASSRFMAGTRIVREWKGATYEVTITPEGYRHNGILYKSLSPIANLITGSRWSGPAFFGTKLKEAK
jgi:hypothetical protein